MAEESLSETEYEAKLARRRAADAQRKKEQRGALTEPERVAALARERDLHQRMSDSDAAELRERHRLNQQAYRARKRKSRTSSTATSSEDEANRDRAVRRRTTLEPFDLVAPAAAVGQPLHEDAMDVDDDVAASAETETSATLRAMDVRTASVEGNDLSGSNGDQATGTLSLHAGCFDIDLKCLELVLKLALIFNDLFNTTMPNFVQIVHIVVMNCFARFLTKL